MEGSSGEGNANLYVRSVDEGHRGEQPDPSELIELLETSSARMDRAPLLPDGVRRGPRRRARPIGLPCFRQ